MPNRRHVALLIETSKSYGRGLLRGIGHYVKEHEPWSMFLEPRALTTSPPPWLRSWKGDGILARISDLTIAKTVFRTNLPVVNLSSAIPNLGFPCIETDPEKLAGMAFTHLLERGLSHFAFFGDDTTSRNWSSRVRIPFLNLARQSGYECAVFEFPPEAADPIPWEHEQQTIGQWLQSLPKPVGVLAINDWQGQRLLDACRRVRLAVPDHVAVIGMENDELACDLSTPPLSSVIMSAEKAGYEAAALLDRMMHSRTPWRINPTIPKLISIEPLGIATRRSTDIQAHEDTVVATTIKFIREHACRGIQVMDVVKCAGVSRSTLDRRMLAAIGRTPHEEIVRVRLEHVQQLLLHTSLKIAAIAQRAGFEHAEYMGVVFRGAFGMSPGEYRKRAQAKLSSETKGRTVLS